MKKNSNHPGSFLLEAAIFKLILLAVLASLSYMVYRCTPQPSSKETVSSSYIEDNTVDWDKIDMGDNLHFCVDGSHKTCDSECECDGLECESH